MSFFNYKLIAYTCISNPCHAEHGLLFIEYTVDPDQLASDEAI